MVQINLWCLLLLGSSFQYGYASCIDHPQAHPALCDLRGKIVTKPCDELIPINEINMSSHALAHLLEIQGYNPYLQDIEDIDQFHVEYHSKWTPLCLIPSLKLRISSPELDELEDVKNIEQLIISHVNLDHSSFKALPPLPKLSRLSLYETYLNDIPHELTEATSLTQLHLSHNQLTHFPLCLSSLKKLQIVTLNNNKMSTLSSKTCGLFNLPFIRKLRVKNNCLRRISKNIDRLALLEELDLSNNQLHQLPHNIIKLRFLKSLDLLGNTLDDASITLLQNALEDESIFPFLTYFKSSHEELNQTAKVKIKAIKERYKNISSRTTSMLRVIDDSGYNILDLSNSGLIDLTGLSDLTVKQYSYDSQNEQYVSTDIKITEIDSLYINLEANPLNIATMKELTLLPNIHGLNINDTGLTDSNLSEISYLVKSLPNLHTLVMDKNRITSTIKRTIKSLHASMEKCATALTQIIEHAYIMDQSQEDLNEACCLENLDVCSCSIL